MLQNHTHFVMLQIIFNDKNMDLKVNCLWLEHYGYDESDPTREYWKQSQSVWFDDIVVARQYIGPMVTQ